MAIILSLYVKEVIKVPKEIQFVILKFVIHDYLENTSFDSYRHFSPQLYATPLHFSYRLPHLTTLIGIDSILDNILADVIKELTFGERIFYSKHLKKFVDFVLAKSVKINLHASFGIELDKVGIKLLNHGCYEYTSTVSDKTLVNFYYNHLEFITFLGCDLDLLGHLFEVTEELKLLVSLKCLKISTKSSQIDLLSEEMIQKLIAWRCHCDCDSDGDCGCDCDGVCGCKGECECAGHINKRLVLSFDLDYSDNDSASMFFSKLIDLNRNGGFEIENHEIKASEPLCSHLLLDSNNDDITLPQLLNLKSPLDNHGLEDLAHFTIDTDKINTALIEDDTRDDQEIPLNFPSNMLDH
ncbi:unnamed protein product [Ambrosiozyma monospora]|uniref:Unnamed protein product n=1 Tax=Ambrosiozyma monospora TaxID=43982 RepID=A0ACB5TBE1_AMBMO|nr:unnamed protein product [Ambrosiozyma monospora]